MSPIKRVSKSTTPTMLEADFANKIIDAINAIICARVVPDGIGRFTFGSDSLVLDLSLLNTDISNIIESSSTIIQINEKIDSIIEALRSPNINAVCNGDGTITISVSFNI